MPSTIAIAVLAETSKARSELGKLNGTLEGFGSKVKGLGKGLLVGVLAGAGLEGLSAIKDKVGETISAASDLQQSGGAVEAVFGKGSKQIEDFASGAAQNLGLSKNTYQELASTLGAGFKNQGIKDYGDQTSRVISLGADLSAQFGGSTKDAVEAIGSLMRGEADPIERYGVGIKQSAVNAELAARGQSHLTGQARVQAEAQARLGLLFKQTGDAQGAFSREGGTLANIQQRNAAATENLKAKFGTLLLPVLTKVETFIGEKVLPVVDRLVGFLQDKLPGAIQTAKGWIDKFKDGFTNLFGGDGGGLIDGIKGYFDAVAPIVKQVFDTVVSTIQEHKPEIDSIVTSIKELFTAIGDIYQQIADKVKAIWDVIGPIVLPIVKSIFSTIISIISGAFKIVAGIFKVIASIMKGDWKGAWDGIKQIVSGAVQIVKAVITNAKNIIGTIFGAIKDKAVQIWTAIKTSISDKISAAISFVKTKLADAKTSASNAWNLMVAKVREAWDNIKNAISDRINSAIEKVRGIKDRAKAALSGIATSLYSAGKNLVSGFINGIGDSLGGVAAKAREIASRAVSAAKSALGINSPSRVFKEIGGFVTKGLTLGLDEQATAKAARSLAGSLVGGFGTPQLAVGSSGSGAVAATNVYITVNAGVGDPVAVGRETVKAVNAYLGSRGKATL